MRRSTPAFVRFGPLWSCPSPRSGPTRRSSSAATGRPCSTGTHVRRRVAAELRTVRHFPPRAAELRSRAERRVSLQVMGIPADPKVSEAYAEAGFDRAVHWLPSAGRGMVERALDGVRGRDRGFHRRVTGLHPRGLPVADRFCCYPAYLRVSGRKRCSVLLALPAPPAHRKPPRRRCRDGSACCAPSGRRPRSAQEAL